MIINEDFVFIHNPRTGGSFVKNFFKRSFPESEFLKLTDYHLPISVLDDKHKDKLKFGLIRNPWSWYVSLYHFQQPNGKWLHLCSPNKKPTFAEFVKILLSTEFAKKHKHKNFHPVGNPKAQKSIPVFQYIHSLDIGFFTYRYIYMFFNDYKKIFTRERNVFKDHDELLSIDRALKTEELPDNIIKLFDNKGIRMSQKNKEIWRSQPKRNFTTHKPYQSYYNEELIELVRHKDRLIIDKYGYSFDL